MTQSPSISIMVCTRNRAAHIESCLTAIKIAVEAHPEIPVELIVVDNGSTDETAAVVTRWSGEQAFGVKLVCEPRPGLSRARNAGMAHARSDIVAMTDDDCLVRPDYILRLAEAYRSHSAPSIIGGRIELGDPLDLPITIKTESERRTYRKGGKPGGFATGANFTFHRSVYDQVGPFDERFGAGARFVSAEDADFILRASMLGIPIRYEPTFAVDHFHGRRQQSEARRLMSGYDFGDGALYAKHLFSSLTPLRILRRTIGGAAREFLGVSRARHPIVGRFYMFRLKHNIRGMIAYLLRGRLKEYNVSADLVRAATCEDRQA